MTEERRIKFEKIAEKRITEAIKRLRLIGNLSNKRNYSYTDSHVNQIFKALDAEMKDLKNKFSGKNSNSEAVFKFAK